MTGKHKNFKNKLVTTNNYDTTTYAGFRSAVNNAQRLSDGELHELWRQSRNASRAASERVAGVANTLTDLVIVLTEIRAIASCAPSTTMMMAMDELDPQLVEAMRVLQRACDLVPGALQEKVFRDDDSKMSMSIEGFLALAGSYREAMRTLLASPDKKRPNARALKTLARQSPRLRHIDDLRSKTGPESNDQLRERIADDYEAIRKTSDQLRPAKIVDMLRTKYKHNHDRGADTYFASKQVDTIYRIWLEYYPEN
jgi:hypothetical protein